MANNYDSQFTEENDDYALPDLFGEFTPAYESIDEDDYDDEAIIEELEDDEEYETIDDSFHIFESGDFDDYAEDVDLSEAQATEEVIDYAFGFDLFTPATEALDDDLEELGNMDGTNEEDEGDDEPQEDDTGEEDTADTGEDDSGEDESPDDLAAATDEQLEEDNQSPDDEMNEDAVGGDDSATDDISTSDTLGSDPLKSIETKTAYRDKFLILYNSIADSMAAMEDFTPEYNSKSSKLYYKCKRDFGTLREVIYKICAKRMNSITVDEVLRLYKQCVITYDCILKDMHTFSDEYNREMKAAESKEHSRISNMTSMKSSQKKE